MEDANTLAMSETPLRCAAADEGRRSVHCAEAIAHITDWELHDAQLLPLAVKYLSNMPTGSVK